jgi:membrane protein DedA with SNARE-associated domain
LLGDRAAEAESRLRALYGKYGLTALFLSRFLPGVRAIVPPLAGALRVPAGRAALAMGAASAVWYGGISYVAFRIGADWELLSGTVGRYGRASGIAAAILVAVAIATWLVVRRRRIGHQ